MSVKKHNPVFIGHLDSSLRRLIQGGSIMTRKTTGHKWLMIDRFTYLTLAAEGAIVRSRLQAGLGGDRVEARWQPLIGVGRAAAG